MEVDFVVRELTGKFRREFEEVAALGEIAARAELLDLPSGTTFDHPERPLRLLYVMDRRTTGLSGDPTESTSKLRKLLMEIGGSEKTQEEHSGGSYGFGKAVYGGSSRIATVFAYSRTRNRDGNAISVLMGCAYHRAHVFEDAATTGRGFFGRVVEVEGKGLRFDPFTDGEADALAERLGMPRDAGDFGTSILIVDTPLELQEICRGIEEYWWPRLSEDLLDVVLEDADGSRPEPRPRQREDLRPFLEAFDVARQRSPQISGKSQSKTFNRLHDLSLGTLGFTVMPEPEVDDADVLQRPERQDTIALIRSPLMVVEYYGKRTMGLPPIAGAFVAHDDVDGILRRAEPPEHDRWAPNALRLDPEKHENEIVTTILARAWRDLKGFQRSAKPEEAKRPKRLLRLERTLSDWFGSSARRPAPARPPGFGADLDSPRRAGRGCGKSVEALGFRRDRAEAGRRAARATGADRLGLSGPGRRRRLIKRSRSASSRARCGGRGSRRLLGRASHAGPPDPPDRRERAV